jgi:hypothetical protein
MIKIAQHNSMVRHYEQENAELKGHLTDLRRRFEGMAQLQVKLHETEAMNQELRMAKMQAMKTNSTVEHLWQVKRVEFDNINELLQEIRDKGLRLNI